MAKISTSHGLMCERSTGLFRSITGELLFLVAQHHDAKEWSHRQWRVDNGLR